MIAAQLTTLPGLTRPFTPAEATWSRNIRRYQEIMARAALVAPWPVAHAAKPTPHAQAVLDAERLVLGALLTGALALSDLQRAPDELCGHLRHRKILDVLVALLELGARLDVHLAERTCARAKIFAVAVVTTSPPRLCSLGDLVLPPPRRTASLAALKLLTIEARHRADQRAERARLHAVLHDVVDELTDGYLAAAVEEAKGDTSVVITARGRAAYVGGDVLREELTRHRAGRGVVEAIISDYRGVN